MSLNTSILWLNDLIWGWPLIGFVATCALIITVGLRFIQFREFVNAWKITLFGDGHDQSEGDMTPMQAFVNALSTAVGNGSVAGIATAIHAGGPGATLWIFIMGFFGMALRFAEVYLACSFPGRKQGNTLVGGPMIYLAHVPGGKVLSYAYTVFLFFLAIFSGNAMQANSIRIGLVRTLHVQPLAVAVVLFAFILYVMLGGAQRILKVSDRIVPVKVGVFFVSATIVLGYHWAALWPALVLIFKSAFTPQAVAGGALGLTVQNAIRFGLTRSMNASEVALGIASVLYGATGAKDAEKNGIMSMLGAFISSNLVCTMIALMIVASGVWDNGLTSIDLTSSAYETVFGTFGTWVVTFLSVSFGVGVLVTYAYVARSCWVFLTGGRFLNVYTALYCITTFIGSIAYVEIVWNSVDLVVAGLLATNLFGMVWLLPRMRRELFGTNGKQQQA